MMTGPAELGDGQIGTYTFVHNYPMSGLGNLECNNRVPKLTLDLPAGIEYVLNSATINGSAANASLNGNQLTILGNALTTLDDISGQMFAVQLQMNCDSIGGATESVLNWHQSYQYDLPMRDSGRLFIDYYQKPLCL